MNNLCCQTARQKYHTYLSNASFCSLSSFFSCSSLLCSVSHVSFSFCSISTSVLARGSTPRAISSNRLSSSVNHSPSSTPTSGVIGSIPLSPAIIAFSFPFLVPFVGVRFPFLIPFSARWLPFTRCPVEFRSSSRSSSSAREVGGAGRGEDMRGGWRRLSAASSRASCENRNSGTSEETMKFSVDEEMKVCI